MRIGRLRHRLAVQVPVVTRDAAGGIGETWEDSYSRWGSISVAGGSEGVSEGRTGASAPSALIVMRGGSSVTTANRIRFGERVYGVKSVRDLDERGITTEIDAEEMLGVVGIAGTSPAAEAPPYVP